MTNERNVAVQAVVDRITSYQDAAPEGTVDQELRAGLSEAGVELTDDEITSLVKAVEGLDEGDGAVSVDDVLG